MDCDHVRDQSGSESQPQKVWIEPELLEFDVDAVTATGPSIFADGGFSAS